MVYPTEVGMAEYNEIQKNTFGTTEIKYSRPKFVHRVLANLIDIIIFALLAVSIFLIARAVVNKTPGYQNAFSSFTKMRLDSGLYVEGDNKNEINDLISYMNNHTQYTPGSKVYNCEKNLDKFFLFEKDNVSTENYDKMLKEYDDLRLKATAEINGTTYNLWHKDGDEIVKHEDYESTAAMKVAMADWYKNYYDRYLQGYLATTPAYYDLSKTISNYLFFIEIPIGFFAALILTYFVPTLFFRRGRQTLGKALYRIGTVDGRYLAPTFWRNLAKFGIFIIEMVAGIASVGVIYLASFSMMLFTKNKQSFPEFMLGLQEVDVSRNKIYMSMIEAQLENVQTNKKPSDFKLIDEP